MPPGDGEREDRRSAADGRAQGTEAVGGWRVWTVALRPQHMGTTNPRPASGVLSPAPGGTCHARERPGAPSAPFPRCIVYRVLRRRAIELKLRGTCYIIFLEEPGLSFIMKPIVYNPSYKDNSERNKNYIQVLARISGLPRRRRSKPSMKPIATPTMEKDFDKHQEQHIGNQRTLKTINA